MREYTRAYDEQLTLFKNQLETQDDQAGYNDEVKVYVSSLISMGENAEHIAQLLNINQAVVIGWHADIFLNNDDLVFGIDDFTGYRKNNLIIPDARTKGSIVKGIIEETITREQALELMQTMRSNTTMKTINNWVVLYQRDYNRMTLVPAHVEWIIHHPYVNNIQDAARMQRIIFEHDREENEEASRLREADRQAR